jgi:LPXTG-motif cell wall-anchored protein
MRTRWIIAAVLIVIGAAWMGQGLGLLPGTGFMDGDITWAVIGAILAIAGIVVAWTAFRKRPVA